MAAVNALLLAFAAYCLSVTTPTAGYNMYDLRLVGGKCPSAGRLETYYSAWGTISNNTFSDYAARVACRKMGYEYGLKTIGPQGEYRMWMSSVKCTEAKAADRNNQLKDCQNIKLRYSNSKFHISDVSVQCYHKYENDTISLDCDGNPYPSDNDIRQFRKFCDSTGLLMMFQNHAWHDFCHTVDSNVDLGEMMCNKLGYARGVTTCTYIAAGYYVNYVTDLQCPRNSSDNCTATFGTCSLVKGLKLQCFTDDNVDCAGQSYPVEGDLRLAAGRCQSDGRLEIAHNGRWGTISKHGFSNDSASVACKQLGYEMGILYRPIQGVSGQVWLDRVKCRGSCFDTLLDCDHSEWSTRLSHSHASLYNVGVSCYNYTNFRDCGGRPLASDNALALVAGNSTSGRLEIFHTGRWGTICDDSFTNVAATVACRQLGFNSGKFGPRSLAPPGTSTTWLDDVVCSENHRTIAECSHRYWGREDCGHDEDVRVSCSYAQLCDSNPCQNNGTCGDGFTVYRCHCVAGFVGANCQTNVNDCASASRRCINGGTCIDGINDFSCLCMPGYKDKSCETEIDECDSGPCLYGATCSDELAGFTCACSEGFKGTFCDINVNECMTMPCHNGGQCEDRVNDFFCSCSAGFEGKRCNENVNECASNPCQNNATCLDGNNWYFCKCIPGFHGHHCEISVFYNECVSNPCQNNGTCIDGDNRYACRCLEGYSGSKCQISHFTNECNSNPCQNSGTCFNGNGWYVCKCPDGFTGHDCEVSEDEDYCASSPCLNGGTCYTGNGWFVCNCALGYSGHKCNISKDTNMCSSSPCLNGGTCSAGDDLYVCSCPPTYLGTNCQTKQQVDSCASNPCVNNGTCYDGPTWYMCKCPYGFTGPECQHVTDINECASNPCRNGGTCLDGKNWFVCKCPAGFSGTICQTGSQPSACASNPCANNGTCLGNNGWYMCKCAPGYTGHACHRYQDADRCRSNPCMNNGTCLEGQKWYLCQCPSGYSGTHCESTQEVLTPCQSSPCIHGGTCAEGKNWYACHCPGDYEGITCETAKVPDPCQSAPCLNQGRCLTRGNEYYCHCPETATGTNCESKVLDACSSNPCQHNGTCLSARTWYFCKCLFGYTGDQCEAKAAPPDHTPAASVKMGPPDGQSNAGYLSLWIIVGILGFLIIIFSAYLFIRWRRHQYLSKGRPKTGIALSMEFDAADPEDDNFTTMK